MLIALNYLAVLIYGILIMAFFLDIKMNRKNILFISVYVVLSGFLQLALYSSYGWNFIEKSYPLVIHLPLLIFFCAFFKKRFISVLFVLFTAYVLTSPRKWIGNIIASFFNNDSSVSIISQIIFSVVFLVAIYMFLRPHINKMLEYSGVQIYLLTVMPSLYYILTYVTTVYTDVFRPLNILVVGVFGIVLNLSFYSFWAVYFNEMTKSFVAQNEQTVLQMQIDTTAIQIEGYKNSQKQAAIYRHDLRHHLHYLSTCIAENHSDEALSYISKINRDVEAVQVVQYCENTSVNLILSAYAAQSKGNNIAIEIDAFVPTVIPMHSTDICIILANSIENAIHACRKIENVSDRKISVSCRYRNKKLMIEICNTVTGEIRFVEDIPVSTEEHHGFGIKSIKAAVKKYQGMYSFTLENGIFTMRVILQG